MRSRTDRQGSSRGIKPPATKPAAFEIHVAPAQTDASDIPEGERKTVTALFADIKGSMELIEDLDPEEARRIVDPALKLMSEAAHRYEGYVVQSTGDGIFALFGAPIAHEDHTQRALLAALKMQEDIKRYASKLREEGRAPIEIRVGVNTGEMVVRSVQTGDASHRIHSHRAFDQPGGADAGACADRLDRGERAYAEAGRRLLCV